MNTLMTDRRQVSMKLATLRALCVVAIAAVSACSNPPSDAPRQAPPPAPSAAANLANYHNGLTDADRQTFYHLSEGSEMFPLAILQSLERKRTPQDPSGDGLVPFTDNLRRYGFIPDDKSDQNPFTLPVGMTVERSHLTNRVMVGFNCTTCHVGELWRNGRRVRVDGGPNMVRINDLFEDMKGEVDATLKDTAGRRERFLANIARHRIENDAAVPSDRALAERARILRPISNWRRHLSST